MDANISLSCSTQATTQTKLISKRKEGFLDSFVHFFVFLSTLFIGADIIGINIGVNLRLDQLFLLISCFFMTLNNSFRLKKNNSILFFALFSLISLVLSVNIARGIMYYFFIVFNIIFIFYLYSNYIQKYGPMKFMSLFRKTIYVSFIIFITQYVLKIALGFEFSFLPTYGEYFGVPRFRLWFYEPSYMATFFLFWFAFSLYMLIFCKYKSFKLDLILTSIILLLCTSTSGYIGVGMTLFFVYLLWLKKGISLKKLSILFLLIILLIILRFAFSNIYNVFVGRLFEGSLNAVSGGRMAGWTETINVFKQKPLFGVGPGCYGTFLGVDPGYMPTNVTLEIMATLGIFATISFFALHISLFRQSLRLCKYDKNSRIIVGLCFALFIFVVILQFNQGYLRLYHWMFLGIIDGFLAYYKKAIKIKKEGEKNEGNNISRG